MGYYMQQEDSKFFIAKENKEHALRAIKNLANRYKYYAWVCSDDFVNATDLQAAMAVWRWEVYEDENGNIDSIQFAGQKSGDDETLFRAIAMYVQKDSYIEMHGEDGCMWRWVFDGDTCKEKFAQIDWV